MFLEVKSDDISLLVSGKEVLDIMFLLLILKLHCCS